MPQARASVRFQVVSGSDCNNSISLGNALFRLFKTPQQIQNARGIQTQLGTIVKGLRWESASSHEDKQGNVAA